MNDAALLLELLGAELDRLRESDPSLDWDLLDQFRRGVAAEIQLDEMFGPRIDEPHLEMHSLLDEAETLGREARAFMAAGLRAFRALEARQPAA